MQDNPQSIDWEGIWKSLDWDDEERRQASEQERLRQRARQYAAPIRKHVETSEIGLSVLVFDLGSEIYGLDVMSVRAVRALPRITRVPGTPAFYRGVVNLRGQIITVMDLRLFLGLSFENEASPPGELVLVKSNYLEIGLLAHNVRGVVTVPNNEIEPAGDTHYILGVTASRLVLLNVIRIFDDPRLIIGENET